MVDWLYRVVYFVADIHDRLLSINDGSGYMFSDKTLHFLVMGIVGMLILLAVYPLFKALSKNHVLVIAFIYAITLMVVITFSIEIGQGLSGTGAMEMEDVQAGLAGFLAMFIVFAVIRMIVLGIIKLFKGDE